MTKSKQIITFLFSIIYINVLFGQNAKQNLLHNPIPFDSQVRYGKLENGFTYYIRKNDNPAKRIELRLIVKAGTLYEEADQLGLAHLTEHMGLKGLKHFPNGIHDYLYKEGIARGNVNAFTAHTYTCYELPIPAGKTALLDSSLLILKDWCNGFLLKENEIDEERGAIIREVDGGTTNQYLARLNAQLLRHPKYTVNNLNKVIENYRKFEYPSLINFYKKWYTPDRQAAIIVGDVNVDEVEKRIKHLFSDIPTPIFSIVDDTLLSMWAVSPDGKNSFIKINNDSSSETLFQIYTKVSAQIDYSQKTTIDQYRMEIKDKLYRNMADFRFGNLPKQNMFNFLSSFINRGAINKAAQIDALYTAVEINASQQVKIAFQSAMIELEKIRRYGFTEKELATAKERLKRISNKDVESISSKHFIDKYIGHFVFRASAPSPEYENALINKIIDDISLQESNQFIKKWMNKDRDKDIIVKGPSKNISLLNEDTVQKWIDEVEKMKINPTVNINSASDVLGRIKWPSFSNKAIIKEAKIHSVGLKEIQLGNGAKVILKPVKSANLDGRILLEGYALGGYNKYLDIDSHTARTSASIIYNKGFGGISLSEIDKYLWGKNVKLTPYVQERYHGIYGSTDAIYLETMLQLVYLYFTKPNYESTQDPAYVFFKEYFSNARDFVFIVVGDINLEKHEPIILRYLNGLSTSNTRYKPVRDPIYLSNSPSTMLSSIKENSERSAFVDLQFIGSYSFNESTNMAMKLLGTILEITLQKRLRGREGATYGVSVNAIFSRENNYKFHIRFETAADKAQQMLRIALEEIEKLKSSGIAPVIYEQSVSQELLKIRVDILSNRDWMNYLTDQYKHNEHPEAIIYRTDLLKKFTAKDLQKNAQELLNTNNILNSKQ